jgi:hypothetical protein
MYLESFAYSQYKGAPKQWDLSEFQLNDINLIVGSNASGKSRTLNVISGLSRILLTPKIPFRDGSFYSTFKTNNNDRIKYFINTVNGIIESEELTLNNEKLINRNKDGEGKIFSHGVNQLLDFKVPQNEPIAYRRDEIQFPYLLPIYNWALNLRHFRFAKEHEKQTIALVDANQPKVEDVNLKETDKAIALFNRGKKKHGDSFVNNIIHDFNKIGFSISNVFLSQLESIQIESAIPSKVVGLIVKEKDLKGNTDQGDMSDGMFRALSMIIHFNYYKLENLGGLVLIDDIGEGLDFERSSKLIKLIIQLAKDTGIQLIMSTNDKFVMNNTKLDYWQVISRKGSQVTLFNKNNSEDKFKQFKFTGLNNFEFFTTDFFKTGLK